MIFSFGLSLIWCFCSQALESAALLYLKAHFTEGVLAVFAPKEGVPHYTIQIVANKYNPTNFW